MYSKKVLPGEVRDEQGRRRFHGAFTGGFSAGYYNSVGSEEGFTPSTFVSSRDKRANVSQQRAEDFMDEEDGLLGKEVIANAEYDTLGSTSSAAARMAAINEARNSHSLIPGAAPMELMVVSGQPIGKRLLQTMGWREGTGVGARVKRHARKHDSDDDEATMEVLHPVEGGDGGGGGGESKQAVSSSRISKDYKSSGGSVAELLGESFSHKPQALNAVTDDGEVTFAPNDAEARIVIPKPKNDTFGIGYDPFKENPELENARRGNIGSSITVSQ
jgi:G patch domain-containing protein 1